MNIFEIKPTVLVADDDADNRRILADLLEDHGYPVVLAKDGLDAMRKVRGGGIQVAVLDVDMPRMDGLQACELIRSDSETGGIPVLMLTGFDSAMTRGTAKRAGALDSIEKPCAFGDLLARVGAAARLSEGIAPSEHDSRYPALVAEEQARRAEVDRFEEQRLYACAY